jgi:signal transduction histidine kinase
LLRDATERRETRTELRRQNDQLDDFASSVSHYLRNPLQVASGQTELARQALADHPAHRDRLDDVARSLDRMETIIADLRTLAKQGKSVESTEPLAFGEAVTEAWSHVGGEATVTVGRDGTIQADHGRLLSILENLIRNSVERGSAPDGGVTIEARLTDDGFVLEDDGPGIDADHERLFEYGYTTSSDGTGLGLSIVETMAQSHGWSVRVDTDHDGARFVVTGAVTEVEGD